MLLPLEDFLHQLFALHQAVRKERMPLRHPERYLSNLIAHVKFHRRRARFHAHGFIERSCPIVTLPTREHHLIAMQFLGLLFEVGEERFPEVLMMVFFADTEIVNEKHAVMLHRMGEFWLFDLTYPNHQTILSNRLVNQVILLLMFD